MTSPRRYTDDEILSLVHFWETRYPEGLTLDLFSRETGIGHSTIQRRFGGWLALRTAAGLERRKSHLVKARTHTLEEFATKLKVAVGHYGKFITQQEFCAWMGIAPNTLQTYCGNWRKLRGAVGLPERRRRQRLYSDLDLITEVSRLGAELRHWPTAEEINRHGRFSYATYAERFGGMPGVRRYYDRFLAWCKKEWDRRQKEQSPGGGPPASVE